MKESNYLKNKCQNLSNTLDFFAGNSGGKAGKEKRLVFLAQIDFWNWEMDELIFTFDTFAERAKAWNDSGLDNMLSKNSLYIDSKAIDDVKERRYYRWHQEAVDAPWSDLNLVITKWNELLRLCEDTVLFKGAEKHIEQFGMVGVDCNLKKYYKELILAKRKKEDER